MGTAMKMLLAKAMDAALSLVSVYVNTKANIEAIGRAMMKPASAGFFCANHEVKTITQATMMTLMAGNKYVILKFSNRCMSYSPTKVISKTLHELSSQTE